MAEISGSVDAFDETQDCRLGPVRPAPRQAGQDRDLHQRRACRRSRCRSVPQRSAQAQQGRWAPCLHVRAAKRVLPAAAAARGSRGEQESSENGNWSNRQSAPKPKRPRSTPRQAAVKSDPLQGRHPSGAEARRVGGRRVCHGRRGRSWHLDGRDLPRRRRRSRSN